MQQSNFTAWRKQVRTSQHDVTELSFFYGSACGEYAASYNGIAPRTPPGYNPAYDAPAKSAGTPSGEAGRSPA
jgi:hypothetical protein